MEQHLLLHIFPILDSSDQRVGRPILGLAPRILELPIKQQHPHALLGALHGVPGVVVDQKGRSSFPAQPHNQGCQIFQTRRRAGNPEGLLVAALSLHMLHKWCCLCSEHGAGQGSSPADLCLGLCFPLERKMVAKVDLREKAWVVPLQPIQSGLLDHVLP